MDDFLLALQPTLLAMQDNIEVTLPAAGLGFFIGFILIWLIMSMLGRARLNRLRTALKKEITASEQKRTELGAELNQAQQKLQQTEQKLTEQTAQLAELEKEKQAQTQRANEFEAALKQENDKVAQLNLQKTELARNLEQENQQRVQLEQQKQRWQADLTEKEATVRALTETVNEKVTQIVKLEQDVQQYRLQLDLLQQEKLIQQKRLDQAVHIQQIEPQLSTVQAIKTEQVSISQPVFEETETEKQTADKPAEEAEKTVVAPEAEVKEESKPKEAEPAPKPAKKFGGVMGFFKKKDKSVEKIETIEEKTVVTPESELKKEEIAPVITPEVEPKKEEKPIVTPEPEAKKEESVPKAAKKSGGVMGFFKKLDKSAETARVEKEEESIVVSEPEPKQEKVKTAASTKSEPQKVEATPKAEKKNSGVMGFFKKLDKSAETVTVIEEEKPVVIAETKPKKEKATGKNGGIMGFIKNLDNKLE